MAETLTTKFSDSQGSGKIKLYANAFANGNGYYGRFERNTIGTNALITAHEPVKTCSEAECFHNKPPAMRVVGKSL